MIYAKITIGTILLIVIIIAVIMPHLGRFSKEYYFDERIEKIEIWKQQVDEYIFKKGDFPDSLYEVYLSSGTAMNPSMLWIANVGNKHGYMTDNNVLKQKDKFLQFIDYELFKSSNAWEISEKVIYNNISDHKLKINNEGIFFIENDGKWEKYKLAGLKKNSFENKIEN